MPLLSSERSSVRLLSELAAALLLVVVAVASCASEDERGHSSESAPQSAAEVHEFAWARGYVGSDACARCHVVVYRKWKDSLHSHMEQPATPASVVGGFTPEGAVLPLPDGRRLVMTREDDRFYVEAPDASGHPQRYLVDRSVGNRFKQRYVTRFPDGSWHALPAQWNIKDRKWVEWGPNPKTPPEERASTTWAQQGWQWQLKCAGCHTTGLVLGYDPRTKTYDTHWRELAIGCESCHGPGAEHVRAGGGKDNILCPSNMTHTQQLEVCGQCHSRGSAGPDMGVSADLPGKLAYPHAMRPGDRLDEHFVQETLAKNPGDFYDDGSSRNHHQQLTDYRQSDMLHDGGSDSPTCTTCHEPHAAAELTKPVDNNALCLQCHDELRDADALAAHTGHGSDPLANAGARCVECHMPRIVVHAGSQKLRSHTFWGPNPKRAAETQTPDACLLCHTDKDSAWSQAAAAKLWPEGEDGTHSRK